MPCRVCGEQIEPAERVSAGFDYCKRKECGRWARTPLELVELKSGKTGTLIVQKRHVVAEAAAGRSTRR
jgi:hypothetical protein